MRGISTPDGELVPGGTTLEMDTEEMFRGLPVNRTAVLQGIPPKRRVTVDADFDGGVDAPSDVIAVEMETREWEEDRSFC